MEAGHSLYSFKCCSVSFLCTQRPASLQLAKVKIKIIAVKESISCVHFLSFCFKSAQIYTLFIYCARKR